HARVATKPIENRRQGPSVEKRRQFGSRLCCLPPPDWQRDLFQVPCESHVSGVLEASSGLVSGSGPCRVRLNGSGDIDQVRKPSLQIGCDQELKLLSRKTGEIPDHAREDRRIVSPIFRKSVDDGESPRDDPLGSLRTEFGA